MVDKATVSVTIDCDTLTVVKQFKIGDANIPDPNSPPGGPHFQEFEYDHLRDVRVRLVDALTAFEAVRSDPERGPGRAQRLKDAKLEFGRQMSEALIVLGIDSDISDDCPTVAVKVCECQDDSDE